MNEKRWSEMHSKRITITLDDFEEAAARALATFTRLAHGTTGVIGAMILMPFEAELAHRLFEPEHFADEDEAKMDEVRDADRGENQ